MRARTLWSSSSSSSYISSDEEEADVEDDNTSKWSDDEKSDTQQSIARSPQTSSHSHIPNSSAHSADTLDRLRRIFRNKTTEADTGIRVQRRNTQQSTKKYEHKVAPSRVKRIMSNRLSMANSPDSPTSTSSRNSDTSSEENRGNNAETSFNIDHHIQRLCHQVEHMAKLRNANTDHICVMLENAINELRYLKKQEEQTYKSQVTLIQESYALRLGLFAQQYQTKVAEIHLERQAAITQQRERSEAVIMAAAERLQNQTQYAVLQELQEGKVGSSRQPEWTDPHTLHNQDNVNVVESRERRPSSVHNEVVDSRERRPSSAQNAVSNTSPVSRQKEKLKALEARLAKFSKQAVDRAALELQTQQQERQQLQVPSQVKSVRSTANVVLTHPTPSFSSSLPPSTLQPTPLSPLRTGQSYWRNGISIEKVPTPRQSKPSQSSLTKHYLLPEEEKELAMLRNRIGLAKEWMITYHKS